MTNEKPLRISVKKAAMFFTLFIKRKNLMKNI